MDNFTATGIAEGFIEADSEDQHLTAVVGAETPRKSPRPCRGRHPLAGPARWRNRGDWQCTHSVVRVA